MVDLRTPKVEKFYCSVEASFLRGENLLSLLAGKPRISQWVIAITWGFR